MAALVFSLYEPEVNDTWECFFFLILFDCYIPRYETRVNIQRRKKSNERCGYDKLCVSTPLIEKNARLRVRIKAEGRKTIRTEKYSA